VLQNFAEAFQNEGSACLMPPEVFGDLCSTGEIIQ
jgi:hypothetical protein